MENYRYLVIGTLLIALFGSAALALHLGHPSIALLCSSLFCLAAAEHLCNIIARSRHKFLRTLALPYLQRPLSLLLPCLLVALLWYSAGPFH